jgi:hypothetical protein
MVGDTAVALSQTSVTGSLHDCCFGTCCDMPWLGQADFGMASALQAHEVASHIRCPLFVSLSLQVAGLVAAQPVRIKHCAWPQLQCPQKNMCKTANPIKTEATRLQDFACPSHMHTSLKHTPLRPARKHCHSCCRPSLTPLPDIWFDIPACTPCRPLPDMSKEFSLMCTLLCSA